MVDATFDELAQVLREMAERFGTTAFTDRRRLVSLLSDRLPDARRDIRVVASAMDERVFDVLARTRPEQLGMEVERLAARLENGLGIRSDIAIPVVQACAYGLSLGPLPSAAGARQPADIPAQRPAPVPDNSWVGLSEPVRPAATVVTAAPPPIVPASPRSRRTWLMWSAAAIVLVIGGLGYLGGHLEPDPTPAPPAPVALPTPQPQPQPQPQPAQPSRPMPQPAPVQPPAPPPQAPEAEQPQPQYYGQEDRDFRIPPQSTLKSAVSNPTPTSIPGAITVTAEQVMTEMRNRRRMILIDALQGEHATIAGAVYLPFAGQGGNFNDQIQSSVANDLSRLTQGRKDTPLVFFCQGVNCWESYNAALRAHAAGFPNVFWFRGGLMAWQEAGFPMQPQ